MLASAGETLAADDQARIPARAGTSPATTSTRSRTGGPRGRTDQGVDTCLQGDRPAVAIGDAKVVGSDDHSGWPVGYFIWYRLLDSDHADLYIYVAGLGVGVVE